MIAHGSEVPNKKNNENYYAMFMFLLVLLMLNYNKFISRHNSYAGGLEQKMGSMQHLQIEKALWTTLSRKPRVTSLMAPYKTVILYSPSVY